MKSFVWLSVCLLAGFMTAQPVSAALLVGFDELSGYTSTGPTGSYFNGYGFGAATGTWQSQGVSFNTKEFGPGWSYSNVNNTTLAGFTNQWAAYPGTGAGGSGNYAIGNSNDSSGAYFNLPTDHTASSLLVTNTTYAAQSILNGDNFAKKFGGVTGNDPDFFRVTFTGFDAANASGATTGSVEFFLADYRFANNALDYVVNDWQLVNLSNLGGARSIGISLDGTDNHPMFGLNTPPYVAIDSLSLTAVPEPSSLALLGCVVCFGFARSRRPH